MPSRTPAQPAFQKSQPAIVAAAKVAKHIGGVIIDSMPK